MSAAVLAAIVVAIVLGPDMIARALDVINGAGCGRGGPRGLTLPGRRSPPGSAPTPRRVDANLRPIRSGPRPPAPPPRPTRRMGMAFPPPPPSREVVIRCPRCNGRGDVIERRYGTPRGQIERVDS